MFSTQQIEWQIDLMRVDLVAIDLVRIDLMTPSYGTSQGNIGLSGSHLIPPRLSQDGSNH